MNIHQVIKDVRAIKVRLINSGYFFGYSSAARLIGGVVALAGAAFLSCLPTSPGAHLIGWAVVFSIAVTANYFALFLKLEFSKDKIAVEAVLEPLLPIITGGAITAALVAHDYFGPLFGVWMALFGLANIVAKRSFSRHIALVGYFYLVAGCSYLIVFPVHDFTNPWPMGLAFFIGESVGAWAFHRHNKINREG